MERNKISDLVISFIFCVLIFVFGILTFVFGGEVGYKPEASLEENIKNFENDFKEDFFRRYDVVNLHGLTQRLILNNVVEDAEYDAMVRTKWNQVTSVPGKSDLKKLDSFVSDVHDFSKQHDIQTLYIQAPFKILPSYEDVLPTGVKTYVNENVDNLLASFDKKGIDYYDLRPVLEQSHLLRNELFYDTDHHWTIKSAFYCYRQLVKFMYEKYGYCSLEEMEFFSDEMNYYPFRLEKAFLGSWGRRVGELYSGLDNFDYYVPAFYTNFDVTNRAPGAKENNWSGDFYNRLMTPKWVEEEGDGIKTNRYSVYLNGYTSEVIVNNTESQNDKKVLIFHDSFGFPLSAFMCLTAKQTTVIDLRVFEKDVFEYIEEYDPDYILFIYNPDQEDFVGLK